MWWITNEDGGYLRTRDVLHKKRAYFVNFAIQDDGPGGYDLSDKPGTIEDSLILGTHRACAQTRWRTLWTKIIEIIEKRTGN